MTQAGPVLASDGFDRVGRCADRWSAGRDGFRVGVCVCATPDTGRMGFAVFMTLPGLVILLTAVAFADQVQSQLKERPSALILRDDEEDGAPPNRTMVDLEGGTAVVRMPPAGR